MSDVTHVIIDVWPGAADNNDYILSHTSYMRSLASIVVSWYFLQELFYD